MKRTIDFLNPPPVILVFGEEEFLIEEFIQNLLTELLDNKNQRVDFSMYEGENIALDDLADTARSYSLLADRNIILVKNFDKSLPSSKSKKNMLDSQFGKYLLKPNPSTTLILETMAPNLNGYSKKATPNPSSYSFPFNIILEKYAWFEFPKIWQDNYPKWISEKLSKLGLKASPDAIELLNSMAGDNLRNLNNEIEKLILYLGDKKTISVKDVMGLTGLSKDYTVFDLQKAVGEMNLSKSIDIIVKILSYDRQEMLILSILQKFFLILLKITELNLNENKYTLSSQIGVSPYFLDDYLLAARKYKFSQIVASLSAIQDADEQLKSSGGDNLSIMLNMLIKIIPEQVQ
ncbi:MAG TPA: DNA polymerase III subunit delta [Bacteroidota bacterium]|mgnify:CR=1 FL=1|nr:DNA polymerase III subunit delta [Candidatus Kapabacteria bacterium]HRS00930.1 DNA polymerase III subunit delta [Bacteroidota bacterium]HRT68152.1 DNA polymerase III subunit delta [Bacteroidota bacterium]